MKLIKWLKYLFKKESTRKNNINAMLYKPKLWNEDLMDKMAKVLIGDGKEVKNECKMRLWERY